MNIKSFFLNGKKAKIDKSALSEDVVQSLLPTVTPEDVGKVPVAQEDGSYVLSSGGSEPSGVVSSAVAVRGIGYGLSGILYENSEMQWDVEYPCDIALNAADTNQEFKITINSVETTLSLTVIRGLSARFVEFSIPAAMLQLEGYIYGHISYNDTDDRRRFIIVWYDGKDDLSVETISMTVEQSGISTIARDCLEDSSFISKLAECYQFKGLGEPIIIPIANGDIGFDGPLSTIHPSPVTLFDGSEYTFAFGKSIYTAVAHSNNNVVNWSITSGSQTININYSSSDDSLTFAITEREGDFGHQVEHWVVAVNLIDSFVKIDQKFIPDSCSPLVVTFSGTDGDNNASCDKTFEQIKSAWLSNRPILAKYRFNSYNPPKVCSNYLDLAFSCSVYTNLGQSLYTFYACANPYMKVQVINGGSVSIYDVTECSCSITDSSVSCVFATK